MATTLTWLGHASFRLDTEAGTRVYIDPFLTGNPKCPENERTPERCDLVVLTHGHGDHVGDAVDIAKRFECPVVAPVELRDWLTAVHGLPEADGGRFVRQKRRNHGGRQQQAARRHARDAERGDQRKRQLAVRAVLAGQIEVHLQLPRLPRLPEWPG